MNVSLRRAQFKAAKEGNVTMLIWLGKQRLGQKNEPIQSGGSDRLKELIAEYRALNEHNKKVDQEGS
jgi:hypothetical protein